MSAYLPCILSPDSSNSIFSFSLRSSTTSPPLSHIAAVPAPYCPYGITPSKSAYSSVWSSVWIASHLMRGSVGGVFGSGKYKKPCVRLYWSISCTKSKSYSIRLMSISESTIREGIKSLINLTSMLFLHNHYQQVIIQDYLVLFTRTPSAVFQLPHTLNH